MILFVSKTINGRSLLVFLALSIDEGGRKFVLEFFLRPKEEVFFFVTSLLVFNVVEKKKSRENRARYLTTSIFPISESTDAYRRIDQRKEGRV